jgi:hypothetical protein
LQNLDIKGVRPLFGVRGTLFLTTFRRKIPCAPAPACARLPAIFFHSWSFRPAIALSTPNSIDIMRRGHLINCKSLRRFLHQVRDRMKMFYPMNERGPGGPRYSRPGGRRYISNQGRPALHFQPGEAGAIFPTRGGRRYISKRNIFIRPKN